MADWSVEGGGEGKCKTVTMPAPPNLLFDQQKAYFLTALNLI